MKYLVDEAFPEAAKIRVVMDNLATHSRGAIYDRFASTEASRILGKLEFHFTPKHASWLNMAEIELSVLARQCLSRRIADKELLRNEVNAWEEKRNQGAMSDLMENDGYRCEKKNDPPLSINIRCLEH